MIDRAEQLRRGQSSAKGVKHPYAATEHRVIDSEAYADLTYSARSLLTMLTRQLTKDNNGYLNATYSLLKRYGFDSDRTITRAINELISHGFVWRTRQGGYQQGPSLYAVTWLPIKNKEGLFLAGFLPCAWRYWKSDENKEPPSKMRSDSRKNGGLIGFPTAKKAGEGTVKNADYELMPCSESKASFYEEAA